jgi:hypothetical protein
MTNAPATYTTGRSRAEDHTIVRYEGSIDVYSPSGTSPGGSAYETMTCGHQHADYDVARRCIEAKAATALRKANTAAAAAHVQRPCAYAVHEDHAFAGDPMYMRVCTSHHRIDPHLHRFQAVAEASTWECPWQPLAGVAPAAPLPLGTRVEVVNDKYMRYAGAQGTVVSPPPEIVDAPSMRDLDFTGTTWVRLDDMDDRTAAVGFDAGNAELRTLPAPVAT